MARVVASLPAPNLRGVSKNAKYPWEKWLDGQAWELTQGEDFTASPKSFRTLAYATAEKRGRRLATRIAGERVFIQAVERGEA